MEGLLAALAPSQAVPQASAALLLVPEGVLVAWLALLEVMLGPLDTQLVDGQEPRGKPPAS